MIIDVLSLNGVRMTNLIQYHFVWSSKKNQFMCKLLSRLVKYMSKLNKNQSTFSLDL